MASTAVNPIDMTVFNGSVLFNGADTAGHLGLWVTNGTGAGTQELNVGATASATGIDPTDMAVLNGMVLFNGVDANGLSGLWAWNGTSATELVAGGGTSSTKGLNPTDMTVFGNEVLFNGLMGTAMVHRGEEGIGKSFFAETLAMMMGKHYVKITDLDQIFGQFNAHIEYALLTHFEEASWAGDRRG